MAQDAQDPNAALSAAGVTPQDEATYWAHLQAHFDAIEVAEYASAADGLASLGDFKRAQQQALQAQDWPAYNALSWMLLQAPRYLDGNGLISKATFDAAYTPEAPPPLKAPEPSADSGFGIDL
jgi:hypothetical protein